MAYQFSPSPRVRRSPFFDATVEDGVTSFSPYNHMLMPTGYGDAEAEYWRLINSVSMWDVAVERQVQLEGPDAGKLAQVLTPRKLNKLVTGQGWYVAICDHRGVIINDPILLRHSDTKYWFSIADGDLKLWARAIAAERKLDVVITEPDVSPLAIQGPKAAMVVSDLLGESAVAIRPFEFREFKLDDIPLFVARSGWSHQGGFELYLCDGRKATELWHRVRTAGKRYGIGPGTPNAAERIESGLLSWGGDTDDETNPFEVRMGRYVDLDAPDDVIGIDALRTIAETGHKRHQLGIIFQTSEVLPPTDVSFCLYNKGDKVGQVTATARSPRIGSNIGMCLVDRSAKAQERVTAVLPDGREIGGVLTALPFNMG